MRLPTLIPLFNELHGERIMLRSFQERDAPDFFAAVTESRERLRLWDSWPDKCKSLDVARHWMMQDMASWLLRTLLEIGIWDRRSDIFLGGIMLRPLNWEMPSFEIGYWLRTAAEGEGYMLEAMQLLTTYVLNELNAQRIMLRIDERNLRSIALAQRLAFHQEGILRNSEMAPDGDLRSMIIFSLLPGDR